MKDFKIDEKQLEFLGDFFSTAAKNAKQFNDFASLFDLKKQEHNDLFDMFKNFYHINSDSKKDSENKSEELSDAFNNFQDMLTQYVSFFNFGDNPKLKELEKKCVELEKQLKEKEKEIKVLKSVIEQSSNQTEVFNNFQKMFVEQGKELKNIMDKVGFFPYSNKDNETKE